LEPAGYGRPVERGPELAEVLVARGDLPKEEVAVRPDAGQRVGAQRIQPRRPVLHDLLEGVLPGCALLDRQPAPGGIDAKEGVGDVLAAHGRDASSPGRGRDKTVYDRYVD